MLVSVHVLPVDVATLRMSSKAVLLPSCLQTHLVEQCQIVETFSQDIGLLPSVCGGLAYIDTGR